ncbi:LOW QUALITY PROTEIN: hypothetical protein PHMEG_0006926 [Phytophthora megakarya]|uniref:Uncharacterized protein n=1 Tax=Phytophthora megakarya TaxID=4795 RepID=A0A225WP91_9STRA|nr:LOW QUALITY PROTEIN: hypothetical protein PHMEG_0006926 [Phytophthora megakarya]
MAQGLAEGKDPPRSRPETNEWGFHLIQGIPGSRQRVIGPMLMENKSILSSQSFGACGRMSLKLINWDGHAQRLMFALHTYFDATRLNTSFYLVQCWNTPNTVSSMVGPVPTTYPERTVYEWRRKFRRDYSYARACAKDPQKKTKCMTSEI